MENKLKELQEALKNDIDYIYEYPTEYDYIGWIELLKKRRLELNTYISIYNYSLNNNETKDLINRLFGLFTELQTLIIATYVKQKVFLNEIKNGTERFNTINLDDDNFMEYTIIGDDEIARLKKYFQTLDIKDDSQKQLLNHYLTFEPYHIKHSVNLWKIVAENLGIMQFQYENKDETLTYDDLENGDVTKLISFIPMEHRKRLEREWLYLKGCKEAFDIPDDEICTPNDMELYTILISIIKENKKYSTIKYCGRDGIQNIIEMSSEHFKGKIKIIKGNNLTIFEFYSDLFFNQLLFIKEIDTIFPELYILSDCMDELIAGKKSVLNKLLIHGYNSNNPSSYSKVFKMCDGIWNKLNKMIEPPISEKEDKLLEDRVEFYKQYGIEILKTKEEQKSIYEEVKKEYNFDDPKKFFESLRTKLFQIDFPEDKRRKIESILCDLEEINFSEREVLYTPTKGEVFRTIEAIIQNKIFTDDKQYIIRFNYKDGITATLKGEQSETTLFDYYGKKIYRWNADITFTLGEQKKKIEIRKKINKCFDSKSIYLLWILDILFETNCLINYTDELLEYEEIGDDYYNSQICDGAKDVYDVLISTTNLPNSIRESMEWKNNRETYYGLTPKEEKPPERDRLIKSLKTSPIYLGDERYPKTHKPKEKLPEEELYE